MSTPRIRVLLLLLIALSVLFVALMFPLIGNIDSVEFLPGRPTSFDVTTTAGGPPPEAPGWSMFTLLMRVLFILALASVTIGFVSNRRIRAVVVVVVLLFGAALLLIDHVGCDRQPIVEDTIEQEERFEPAVEGDLDLEPVEREVTSSTGLYVILAVVLSVLAVAVGGALLARWLKSRPEPADDGYQEILDSISNAAGRLRAGEDPYTVVLYCYQEMIRILSTVGRIDATYLTPREFEDRLRAIGLSGQPVHQLTGIFEIVRYGGHIDETFPSRALACLETLQEAHHVDEP